MSDLIQVPCTISKPFTATTIYQGRSLHSGCKVLDVELNETCYPLAAIKFRNYYTHTLSVLATMEEADTLYRVGEWMCMREGCHCETGGQSWHSIHHLPTLTSVARLRLILRQPSPNWRDFGIRDITLYRYGNQEECAPTNGTSPSELVSRKLTQMAIIARAPTGREREIIPPIFSDIALLDTN